MALSIAIVVVAGGGWIVRYDPLAQGAVNWSPPKGTVAAPDGWNPTAHGPVFLYPTNGDPTTFTYRFSIHNDGPVGVTIKSVGSAPLGEISDVATAMIPDLSNSAFRSGASTDAAFVPFHPFSLGPGREAGIEMAVLRNGGCIATGRGELGLEPVLLTYSVLGFVHHTTFTTDPQVGILLRSCRTT